jgi:Zinc-binding dehydrogenase
MEQTLETKNKTIVCRVFFKTGILCGWQNRTHLSITTGFLTPCWSCRAVQNASRMGAGVTNPDETSRLSNALMAARSPPGTHHGTPFIQTVLPLSEARKAHELSESGHTRGKIVLKVPEIEMPTGEFLMERRAYEFG